MYTSTVTKKGQVTLPAPLRRKLGFPPGTKVVITEADGGLQVEPLDRSYFEQFAGMLSGEGKATETLLKERRKDREREDRRA